MAGQVMAFRGFLEPKTVSQVAGLDSFRFVETVSDGGVVWSENFKDSTAWSASKVSDTFLQVAGSLTLTVVFPLRAAPQSVSVSRNLLLPLDQDPVVKTRITVSQGVNYGIRFFGTTPENASFAAWHEGSSLQHRPGRGIAETITVNLAVESYLADQRSPPSGSSITRVLFYLEVPPQKSGRFSLTVLSLFAQSLQHTKWDSKEASGNFSGMVIDLGSPPIFQNPFQVFVSFDIKGSVDLTYAPYFVRGVSITAQGYTYAPKSITTYELAVLNPVVSSRPSPFRTDPDSSSLLVVAFGGEINFFRLNSVSLRVTSQPPVFGATIESTYARSLLIYFLFFLFIVPVTMVILLRKVFKSEE